MNNNESMGELIPNVKPLAGRELPEDAPLWAHTLNANVLEIMDTMNATMATIDGISEQVQPMVDALTKSPILKMFGGK